MRAFNALLYVVKLKSNDYHFNSVKQKNLTKLKEKFGFKNVEITDDKIYYSKGFPLVTANLLEESIELFVSADDAPLETIMEFLDEIDCFKEEKSGEIIQFELLFGLDFLSESGAIEYFLNSSDYPIEEITNARFDLSYKKGGQKFRFNQHYKKQNPFAVFRHEANLNFEDTTEFSDKYHYELQLVESELLEFLNTRKGIPSIGEGVFN